MTRILVTGATGNVGRAVTDLLAQDRTVQVLALVRDPAAAAVTPTAALDAALDGIDAVFLACGNVAEQVDVECTVVDRAAAAGVRRIVKLSARGAELGSPVAFWHWHALIEQHLRGAGVPSVVLQPSFFMTNLLAAAPAVRGLGLLMAPAGDARISMVDPRDVAAVAATALVEDGHDGRTYVVTGPDAVTYDGVAAAFAEALGRDVGYLGVTPEEARRSMLDEGLPPFVVAQLDAVFAALRRGVQATTTDVVGSVTGRSPHSIRDFVVDHRDVFTDRSVPAAAADRRGSAAPAGWQ